MQSPGFFRHLAIIIYDVLLLVATLFLATFILLLFDAGETFSNIKYFFQLYLLLVSFIFYGWFWTHGGQTLGLKTWKVKVLTFDEQPLTWKHAFKRFFTAMISVAFFGLGILWQLVDRQKHTWHDYFSKTSLFFEPDIKKER